MPQRRQGSAGGGPRARPIERRRKRSIRRRGDDVAQPFRSCRSSSSSLPERCVSWRRRIGSASRLLVPAACPARLRRSSPSSTARRRSSSCPAARRSLPSLSLIGPGERMELAGADVGCGLVDQVLRRPSARPGLNGAILIMPSLMPPQTLPGFHVPSMHRLHRLRVVRAPLVRHRGELRVRAVLRHVGVVGDRVHLLRLGGLHDGGRIGVVRQHVGALRDQRLRRLRAPGPGRTTS